MNTPSHVAASLLIGRKLTGWYPVTALVGGAALPDLPMFAFYGYQKLVGRPEKEIWSELYFASEWQLFFDLFNSIPIFLLLAVVCYFLKARLLAILFASALLHVLCDLPVHNDDAHRHLLPFSHWRFISPVSYWDPKHFGLYFASFELLFSVATCGLIGYKSKNWPMRIAAYGTLSLYSLAIVLALCLWIF